MKKNLILPQCVESPFPSFRFTIISLVFRSLEFWEDHFKCRYPGGLATPYNQNYKQTCSGNERLTRENTKFEAQLQFVSDAVMAFAHAFKYEKSAHFWGHKFLKRLSFL